MVDVDLAGDRKLILHHNVLNQITLETDDTGRVMQHLADLWGYDVLLKEIDTGDGHGAEGAQRQAASTAEGR